MGVPGSMARTFAIPLACCTFTLDGARVRSVETDQTRWDIAADPPPFRVLTLRLTGELRDPSLLEDI